MSSINQVSAIRREYRLQTSQKYMKLVMALFYVGCAGFIFRLAKHPAGRDFVLISGSCFLIPGLIMGLSAIRSRLILDGSRIEVGTALRTFIADRSEIEGVRQMKNNYGRWTRVYLRENRGAFNVSASFTGADKIAEWLKGLPDLDQRDAAELSQQIDNEDSQAATTGAKRVNPLPKAKSWMVILSVAAGLFSFPAIFVTYAPIRTLLIVVLAILPPIALLMVHLHPLWFTVFKRKADPRADLTAVILFPAIGMIYSCKTDPANLVDAFQLKIWFLLVLTCFVVALLHPVWANPSRWAALLLFTLFGAMYSFGLVNAANSLPDRSASQLYRMQVDRKYQTHGRWASSYLCLAPRGSSPYNCHDAEVTPHIYRASRIGDQVCIQFHWGSLHAEWFNLVPCPDQPSAPSSHPT